jgi:hypothetical protein
MAFPFITRKKAAVSKQREYDIGRVEYASVITRYCLNFRTGKQHKRDKQAAHDD